MKKYLEKYQKFEPLTVVCVGDSTTSQEWCHPNWVDWMTFAFKHEADSPNSRFRKIINSGESGETAKFFINNFQERISNYNPDVVIVSLGTNELDNNINPREDIDQLLKQIREAGHEIIAWSPYKMLKPVEYVQRLQELNSDYMNICEKHAAKYVDMYNEFDKFNLEKIFTFVRPWDVDNLYKVGDLDGVHCNEIGNQIIAERILKEFETDLTVSEDWGKLGNMQKKKLDLFLKEK